jgi:preprotein translocase subunit SecY
MEKLKRIFTIKEIRNKILFVLAMLVVFRAAANIPVPGIDTSSLQQLFQSNQLLGLLNVFTGGSMDQLSVVMLGLGPYITAVIIMQLLTMIFPKLKELYHERGEEGRRTFNRYSRLLTIPLAALQSFGLISLFSRQGLIVGLGSFTMLKAVIIATAGAIFLMWLGELISEKGIGNGVSFLIFAGIIARIPTSIRQAIQAYSPEQILDYLSFIFLAVAVIAAIAFITESQRNIPVAYTKRVRGRKVLGGAATYLPLKVNQAGVIPIIFALSLLLFPNMIASFLAGSDVPVVSAAASAVDRFLQNQFYYGFFYFWLVVGFTYFYTSVTFDPKVIAENLQRQGAFVPGVRPGAETRDFFAKTMNRITLAGALFLGAVAVLPIVLQSVTGVAVLTIGGTAVLIVVAVLLDIVRQVDAQLAMREY